MKQRQKLKEQKVVDHDLILLTGLSDRMANEVQLGRHEFLGQYGGIRKISVNRDKLGGRDKADYIQTYVTFCNELCASLAILALDGFEWEGRALRATFGTNKYCPSFLRGFSCGNSDCLYLHKVSAENENLAGEEAPAPRTVSRLTLASFVSTILPRWRAGFRAKVEESIPTPSAFPSVCGVITRVRHYLGDTSPTLEPKPTTASAKKHSKKKETGKRLLCTNDMLWSADEEEAGQKSPEDRQETGGNTPASTVDSDAWEENTLPGIASKLTELDQNIFVCLNYSLRQLQKEQSRSAPPPVMEGRDEAEILQNIRQFCESFEIEHYAASTSRNESEFHLYNQSYLVELPQPPAQTSN